MSYRAFKRLLGETSLERKCRFLFGGATLLLITASFYWYARQTDELAYSQVAITGGLLVGPILDEQHNKILSQQKKGVLDEDAIPGKKQGPSKDDDLLQRLSMWLRAKRASKGATEASLPKEF